MPDNNGPIGPITRLWRACLLLLGSVLAIWLSLRVLETIWGWLVLMGIVALAVAGLVIYLRARQNRW